MVLAHSRFSEYGNLWINMFHMPLFFFVSGFCFKESYLETPIQYAQKKISSIWWPYVKWTLIFLFAHNIFCSIGIYTAIEEFMGAKGVKIYPYENSAYPQLIKDTLLLNHREQLLGGYWFLKTLFYASIISYVVIKTSSLFGEIKKICMTLIGIVFMLILGALFSYLQLRIPLFSIGSREFIASAIVLIGYTYRNIKINLNKTTLYYLIPVTLIVLTLGMRYWQMTLLNITWWKIIPFVATSLLATITIIECCKIIGTNNQKSKIVKLLIKIGDNTITILTWHFLCFKLVSLVIIWIYHLPMNFLGSFPAIELYAKRGWFIVYFIIGIFIPLLMSKSKIFK